MDNCSSTVSPCIKVIYMYECGSLVGEAYIALPGYQKETGCPDHMRVNQFTVALWLDNTCKPSNSCYRIGRLDRARFLWQHLQRSMCTLLHVHVHVHVIHSSCTCIGYELPLLILDFACAIFSPTSHAAIPCPGRPCGLGLL